MKTTLVAIFHSRMVTTLLGLKLSSVEKRAGHGGDNHGTYTKSNGTICNDGVIRKTRNGNVHIVEDAGV